MRLGQLARKLAIRQSEIVEFLAANNIPMDESSNTRLEEDQVILIMKQFAPASTGDAAGALIPSGTPNVADVPFPAEVPTKREVQNERTGTEDKSLEISLPSHTAEEVKSEVIKAPKVELSGLKVVGKIDLTELKKKETPSSGIESTDENSGQAEKKQQAEGRKPPTFRKERTDQRARRNPIALQREREAQEADRKRQAKVEQEKEQRTKNYYKKVRGSAPTKRIKMVDEPTAEMTAAELRDTPRTWVGRFFNWLKT
jgi:hypothetical protein